MQHVFKVLCFENTDFMFQHFSNTSDSTNECSDWDSALIEILPSIRILIELLIISHIARCCFLLSLDTC